MTAKRTAAENPRISAPDEPPLPTDVQRRESGMTAGAAAVEAADTVILAYNPRAGRGSGRLLLDDLCGRLRASKLRVQVSDSLAEIRAATQSALDEGRLRGVISAGGDGTLVLLASRLPPGAPLVPFPLGTENLVAGYLGYSADPVVAAQTVLAGRRHRIDAGRVSYPAAPWRADRMFIVVASAGFDAEVVRRLHLRRRGPIHHLSYAKPILAAMRTYRYPPIRVTLHCHRDAAPASGGEGCDRGGASGTEGVIEGALPEELILHELTVRWAMVFNLPRYAGRLRIAPMAAGDDGLLDFFGLPRGSTLWGLRYLTDLIRGASRGPIGTIRQRCPKIRFEALSGRVPLELDGDYAGHLPVDIEVLPGRITLLLPTDSEIFVPHKDRA